MTPYRWILLGWLMFAISGVFFLVDAIESGDKTALGSAITWIVGVAFFVFAGRKPVEAE
jgi:hypothetical protein